jgi:N-ethylmaleimide reductase
MPDLFTPLQIGPLTLANRVLMAPLTRCRAGPGRVPTALNATYYAQRASAGLIISEATTISEQANGYPDTPGIYTDAQVDGWRLVTDAVHAAGGRIACQLWHTGRMSHPAFQPGGALPVSASAVPPGGEARTPVGKLPRVTPRALDTHEIPGIIEDYARAAANALAAGFDAIELHGANGYLPDQFLRDGTNQRTDAYGGTLQRRARFMLEAFDAIARVWGPARVGVRLSPNGVYNGQTDADPRGTFTYVVRELVARGVGYLHIMETVPGWACIPEPIPVRFFRPLVPGVLVTNAGFTFEKARDYLREGWCDAVAFGTLFISNPDLPARFARLARGVPAPLAHADPATFYTPGEPGYTDYPALAD